MGNLLRNEKNRKTGKRKRGRAWKNSINTGSNAMAAQSSMLTEHVAFRKDRIGSGSPGEAGQKCSREKLGVAKAHGRDFMTAGAAKIEEIREKASDAIV
jgi:hypothetical protein